MGGHSLLLLVNLTPTGPDGGYLCHQRKSHYLGPDHVNLTSYLTAILVLKSPPEPDVLILLERKILT